MAANRTRRTAQDYKHFAKCHDYPWCWACGRSVYDVPEGWHFPWFIERAHMIPFPVRIEDVRAVALLCSLCHKTSHGERVILTAGQNPLPRLQPEHLLDLKRRFDRENYDREWLKARYSWRVPERSEKLPAIYLAQYRERRAQ